jgi:hypothetical protein
MKVQVHFVSPQLPSFYINKADKIVGVVLAYVK